MEPPGAEVDSAVIRLPFHVFDAERFEEPRRQVITQGFPGHLRDDRRKHIGRTVVIDEMGAGLEFDFAAEESPHKVFRLEHFPDRVALVARLHGQQVAHTHRGEMPGNLQRQLVREEADDGVLQRQALLLNRKADGGRRKALAHGKHVPRRIQPAGSPGAFRDDLAVLQQHERIRVAVQRVARLHHFPFEAFDERLNRRRIDPLFARQGAFQ